MPFRPVPKPIFGCRVAKEFVHCLDVRAVFREFVFVEHGDLFRDELVFDVFILEGLLEEVFFGEEIEDEAG